MRIAILFILLIVLTGCTMMHSDIDQICADSAKLGKCPEEFCFVKSHPCEKHISCWSEHTYEEAQKKCEMN